MEDLNLTSYAVHSKLKALHEEQQLWRNKIAKLPRTQAPEIETLTAEMSSYRNREKGIALLQTRIAEFRRLFEGKPLIDGLMELFDEDIAQNVFNNSSYIDRLNRKYLDEIAD